MDKRNPLNLDNYLNLLVVIGHKAYYSVTRGGQSTEELD